MSEPLRLDGHVHALCRTAVPGRLSPAHHCYLHSMATAAAEQGSRKNEGRAGAVHLLTPATELAALRDPTAGVDLMDRHHLNRYESESRRSLKKGISHLLSPQLQVLIREKPRIVLSEKADFAEMLSEEPSGRRIQELSMDLLRKSFMIRKRVVAAGVAADEEQQGGPIVPPDVPMAHQTTNKFSPAFAKKVPIYVPVEGHVDTVRITGSG